MNRVPRKSAKVNLRPEAARCLAKAFSYEAVGKHEEAKEWAAKLVELLRQLDFVK